MRVVATVLGVAGLIAILLGWNAISRLTSDASHRNIAVWLHAPHVGPGDMLDVEVKVYGGKDLGIRSLEITGGTTPVVLSGSGEHWGDRVRSSSGYIASESIETQVQVPPDTPIDTELELEVRVRYVIAARQDAKVIGGTFSNKEKTAFAKISVPVLSTTGRIVAHLLSLGRALLPLLLFTGLYTWLGPKLLKYNEVDPEESNDGPDMFVLLLIAFVAIAGYVLFAQPLMAALGVSSTVLVVLAMIGWILGPPLLAAFVHHRRRLRAAG